jgi:hypothetical protein
MFGCCWAFSWWFWSLVLLLLAPGWSCLCSHVSGWFWLVGLDDWMISRVGLGVLEQEQRWTCYCSLLAMVSCLSGRLGWLFQLLLSIYTSWWFSLALTHNLCTLGDYAMYVLLLNMHISLWAVCVLRIKTWAHHCSSGLLVPIFFWQGFEHRQVPLHLTPWL